MKSIFVGYAENSKAYRLLDAKSGVIVESRDVEFLENKFYHDSNVETERTTSDLNASSSTSNKRNVVNEHVEPRRSQRAMK